MVDRGERILPNQLLGRHVGPEVEGAGSQVAVGELEPGPGECIGKGLLILVEPPGDRLHDRVMAQG